MYCQTLDEWRAENQGKEPEKIVHELIGGKLVPGVHISASGLPEQCAAIDSVEAYCRIRSARAVRCHRLI